MTSVAFAWQEAQGAEVLLGGGPFIYPRTRARDLGFAVLLEFPVLTPTSRAIERKVVMAHLVKSVKVCFLNTFGVQWPHLSVNSSVSH